MSSVVSAPSSATATNWSLNRKGMLCPPSREDRITVTRSGHSPKPCPQFVTLSLEGCCVLATQADVDAR